MAEEPVDEFIIYKRAGELLGRIQKRLLPGELTLAFRDNDFIRIEWYVRIVNKPHGGSYCMTFEQLLRHEELSRLAEEIAGPWDRSYCEAVHKESYKEH